MKRVLCTIPNCPDTIMGVKYTPIAGGMLSDPLPNEEADRLCTINGYESYINVEDAKALAEEASQKAVDAMRDADEAAKVAADLQAQEETKNAALKDGQGGKDEKKGKGSK
ncbi:MAG: hypothetical protein Q7U76_13045 [Nitrospirota bacterium]|nr:hypothetical protein [Nitrospirota bacterium]